MRIFVVNHNSRIGGGISVTRNLLAAFGRLAGQHEYIVTIPPGMGYEETCQGIPRCRVIAYQHTGMLSRWYYESYTLPQIVRDSQPDIIFNMANRSLEAPVAPQATLVHDPHLFYPFSQFGCITLQTRLKLMYRRYHFKKTLPQTRLLFCQTEVARERLRSEYHVTQKIELCPNQISKYVRAEGAGNECPELLRRHAGKFKLFALTRYYPHKNLEILPELFARHRQELADVVVVLTLDPNESPQARKVLETIRARGLENNIITVGTLKQEQLAGYYNHVDALFLPTLLESFSGTYVEAMTYERPILTSDMDFARAVCGPAAEYFNPTDPQNICQAILRVKNDAALRAQLVEAGKQARNIHSLSWDEIGGNVMRELEALAAGR